MPNVASPPSGPSLGDLYLAHRETAEALKLLETMLSEAPLGLGFVDRELRFVQLNERLAAMNGSTVAEQLGQKVAEIVPALWPQIEPMSRRLLEGGEPVIDVEVSGPSPTEASQTRSWLTSFYPVSLDDQIIGIGVIVLDITERKAGEAARQQLAAIVDGSGDAIYGQTTDGIVTSWNGAAEQLFGFSAEEIIGQPSSTFAPSDRTSEQDRMRARLTAGGPHERLETTRRRKDGTLVEVDMTASTATDEAGHVVGLSVIAHDITARRTEQRALKASQQRLAHAQRTAHLGSFEFDLASGDRSWSEEVFRILGLDSSLLPTAELFHASVHPDDLPELTRAWADAVQRGMSFDLELRIVRPDSSERVVRARAMPDIAEDGTIIKLIGTILDDTERAEAARVHRAAETRFEIGFEQAAIGAVIADLEGMPLRVNPAVCTLLGRPPAELLGRIWTTFTHPDEVPLGLAMRTRVAAGHDTYEDERRYVRPDGSVVWAMSNVTLVRDEAGSPQYFFTQLQDITARKQVETELAHQALHDALTGLPNRALLVDRLNHGLAGSRRRGPRLGVVFLDLDQFKVVNDSLGHTLGDTLLASVARRIAEAIRPGDTVARFSGDEFVVVCNDVSAVEAEEIAERVLKAVSLPYTIGDQEIHLTASLGIALADEDATPDTLLRDADLAMYRAKELGRDRVELFDETLRAKAKRRLATAQALRQALEREVFVVHYQPVVDLATGEMVSAEALVRWRRADGSLVPPDDFIPLAEETGLIIAIGGWVLEASCRQLALWQRTKPTMTLAVNLSVRQMLAPDIVGLIRDVLARTGVRPGSLCLELTESLFMGDVEYFGRTLAALKGLGVQLAMDDFGTGYSSLSYLKRFPFDSVKVDRSFVDGLGTDPHDSGLVAAIIAMADALGLDVTAEGVETQDQLAQLKDLNCRRAQGYYLARPMPAADLTELIDASHIWDVSGP
jgi:diguanylate cyclase (GGDEF)-like protein/PAS domain S-box-containing protein